LGDNSGWNTGSELGGNGQHIDPREPRLFAAYAAAFAMDGNPLVFFEDLFDIGTTGKRYSHLPQSTIDLPAKADLINLMQAHQRLAFKDGDYGVPTGSNSPFYQTGSAADHLVIERVGKAIIGITDAFNATSNNSADQQVYCKINDAYLLELYCTIILVLMEFQQLQFLEIDEYLFKLHLLGILLQMQMDMVIQFGLLHLLELQFHR
jgi:hypothetical protein